MAIWAAWSMIALSLQISELETRREALEEAISHTGQEIARLEETDVLDLALEQGYVFREDTVFFDGGIRE